MRINILPSKHKLLFIAALLSLLVALALMVTLTRAVSFLLVVLNSPTTAIPLYVANGNDFFVTFTIADGNPVGGPGRYQIFLGNTSTPVTAGTFTSTGSGIPDNFTVSVITPPLVDRNYDLKVEVTLDTETGARASIVNEVGAVIVDNTPPVCNPQTLTAPLGGEVWNLNGPGPYIITWNPALIIDDNLDSNGIILDYSLDEGASWSIIASGVDVARGTFDWTTPPLAPVQSLLARVRVRASDLARNLCTPGSSSLSDFTLRDGTPPLWANWLPTNTDALFGTILWRVNAWDPENGIASVDWEYYASHTWNLACQGVLTTPPSLYTCEWDSLILPDGAYQIRIVITNQTVPVALKTITDPVTYQIDNTQVVPLKTGWNLVSVDRIPSDYDINYVMWNPLFIGSIKRISTFFWEMGVLVQKTFIPGVVTELSEIRDGQGYWIDMNKDDMMAYDGRPFPEPPAPSPSYPVHAGWNLIGFKSLTPRNSASYLGSDVVSKMQRPLYGFNRYFKIYIQVTLGQDLQPGEGYWLSLNAPGIITP